MVARRSCKSVLIVDMTYLSGIFWESTRITASELYTGGRFQTIMPTTALRNSQRAATRVLCFQTILAIDSGDISDRGAISFGVGIRMMRASDCQQLVAVRGNCKGNLKAILARYWKEDDSTEFEARGARYC